MPAYKQEMPPPGGYAPITFLRKAPKKLNGLLVLGGLYACSAVGFAYQANLRERIAVGDREDEETRIALTPFLVAEQERMYLKHLRRNRDYEAQLMADVPGWKVGHWYDVPVYYNPRKMWVDPTLHEFYVHVADNVAEERANVMDQYY